VSYLEQEHVVFAVAAAHAVLTRPLLAGDDLQAGGHARNPGDLLSRYIAP
jgi:hypothetical protein